MAAAMDVCKREVLQTHAWLALCQGPVWGSCKGFELIVCRGSQVSWNPRSIQDHRDLFLPWLRGSCSFTLHQLTAAGCCNEVQGSWYCLGNSARGFFLQKLPSLFLLLAQFQTIGAIFVPELSACAISVLLGCLCWPLSCPTPPPPVPKELSDTLGCENSTRYLCLRSLNILWQTRSYTRTTGNE